MSGLKRTATELEETWRWLCRQWDQTKSLWDDKVRRDWEEEFWTVLEQQVPATYREMERLAQVINRAQQDLRQIL